MPIEVKMDKRTGELVLQLPDELITYSLELYSDILDEFSFEPMNRKTMGTITTYVNDWFKKRNIEIPEEKKEADDDDEE